MNTATKIESIKDIHPFKNYILTHYGEDGSEPELVGWGTGSDVIDYLCDYYSMSEGDLKANITVGNLEEESILICEQ